MEVVGTCNGQVTLEGQMTQVFDYLSDHKKIIGFNPFCKRVTPLEIDKVYRWDFEVADPTGHPIHVVFFVEQAEIQPHHATLGSHQQSVIKWMEYPVDIEGTLPNDWTFVGRAYGELILTQKDETTTTVDVGVRIAVPFVVPKWLKFLPEKTIKKMAEFVMSVSMQTASKKMMANINKDFKYSVLEDGLAANAGFSGKSN